MFLCSDSMVVNLLGLLDNTSQTLSWRAVLQVSQPIKDRISSLTFLLLPSCIVFLPVVFILNFYYFTTACLKVKLKKINHWIISTWICYLRKALGFLFVLLLSWLDFCTCTYLCFHTFFLLFLNSRLISVPHSLSILHTSSALFSVYGLILKAIRVLTYCLHLSPFVSSLLWVLCVEFCY